MKPKWGPATRAVVLTERSRPGGMPVSPPLIRTTTFAHENSSVFAERFQGRHPAFYQRLGNPTVVEAEARLCAMEEAGDCILFGSGMAAITATLLAMLRPGERILMQESIYGQTATLAQARLVFVETPCNAWLQVVDISAIAEIAKCAGAQLIVDSTFASPCLQQPLKLGESFVVHSGTKYLAGHSDVMCGAVLGSRELLAPIREMRMNTGGLLDPSAAWLLLRGIRTLPIRILRQSATAMEIARFLSGTPRVRAVHYPYLSGHPMFDVASRQMAAGGGVVSFELDGGIEIGRTFVEALRLIPIATSLGGVESLVEVPADLDYSADGSGGTTALRDARRCLVRLSVGLEDAADLIDDLKQALEHV
ncbi:MAG TPA: PLP-dependent aspartate aminotransferase family protein [Steroidobacteraceae bacterium]|nr:PLP-dependent aspartate aminotransferase family protein [Steroidobacteraceae bacterium]